MHMSSIAQHIPIYGAARSFVILESLITEAIVKYEFTREPPDKRCSVIWNYVPRRMNSLVNLTRTIQIMSVVSPFLSKKVSIPLGVAMGLLGIYQVQELIDKALGNDNGPGESCDISINKRTKSCTPYITWALRNVDKCTKVVNIAAVALYVKNRFSTNAAVVASTALVAFSAYNCWKDYAETWGS